MFPGWVYHEYSILHSNDNNDVIQRSPNQTITKYLFNMIGYLKDDSRRQLEVVLSTLNNVWCAAMTQANFHHIVRLGEDQVYPGAQPCATSRPDRLNVTVYR
jgi:hypothetical protein